MKFDRKMIISVAVIVITAVLVISILALEINKSENMTIPGTNSPVEIISDNQYTQSQMDDVKLHYRTVENLIGNLIDKYDETGLDEMRNANFVYILTGNLDGTRYLYIVDPEIGIVGKPDDSSGLQVSIPPMIEDQALWIGYEGRYPAVGLEDIKIQRYFKMHDGLIFTSGFPVDAQGIPK